MGELYRRPIGNGRPSEPAWRSKPITPGQADLLRTLCIEDEGEVDEKWLAGLTAGQAADEIDRRKGKRRG